MTLFNTESVRRRTSDVEEPMNEPDWLILWRDSDIDALYRLVPSGKLSETVEALRESGHWQHTPTPFPTARWSRDTRVRISGARRCSTKSARSTLSCGS